MPYRSDLASAHKDEFIELRPDYEPADSLDEVIAKDVRLVHVERMDNNAYWMGIDLADGRHLRVNFWAGKRSTIRVNAEIEGAELSGGVRAEAVGSQKG